MRFNNLLMITGMLATFLIPILGHANDKIACPDLTLTDVNTILSLPGAQHVIGDRYWSLYVNSKGETSDKYPVKVPLNTAFESVSDSTIMIYKKHQQSHKGACEYDVVQTSIDFSEPNKTEGRFKIETATP